MGKNPAKFSSLGQNLRDLVKAVSLRPIPTLYEGIMYRSRTEARWAVLFDVLGVYASYEPQGYDLDGEWYLPDFLIHDWNLFIEVKGGNPTDPERGKCVMLAEASGKPVFLTIGDPGTGKGELILPGGWDAALSSVPNAALCLCRRCGIPMVAYSTGDNDEGCSGNLRLQPCANEGQCIDKFTPALCGLDTAIDIARNERFGVHS